MKSLCYFLLLFFWGINISYSLCLTCYTDINNFSFEKSQEIYGDISVWIARDKTPAFNCFKNDMAVLNRLNFRKHYRILKDNYRIRSNGKTWSLLLDGIDTVPDPRKIIGWVSHEYLIFNTNPIKNDLTGLYYKGLIIHGDINNGNSISVYENSTLTETKTTVEIQNNFFYVYDYYPRNSGSPESIYTRSLLISPKSHLDVYSDYEPLLVGWIDRKNVIFWNTRKAFEFTPGSNIEVKDENGRIVFTAEKRLKPMPYNTKLKHLILDEEEDYYHVAIFPFLEKAMQKSFKNFIQANIKKNINININIFQFLFFTDIEKIMYFLTGILETAEAENDNRKKIWDNFLRIIIGEMNCIDHKTGKELTLKECNQKRNGIPIKANFMNKTKTQFINCDNNEAKTIACEAKIARDHFRLLIQEKMIQKITMINKEQCIFDIIYTHDLNGDGLIIKDDKVCNLSNIFIRNKTVDDLEDKFFFKKAGEGSVAWIPLKKFY